MACTRSIYVVAILFGLAAGVLVGEEKPPAHKPAKSSEVDKHERKTHNVISHAEDAKHEVAKHEVSDTDHDVQGEVAEVDTQKTETDTKTAAEKKEKATEGKKKMEEQTINLPPVDCDAGKGWDDADPCLSTAICDELFKPGDLAGLFKAITKYGSAKDCDEHDELVNILAGTHPKYRCDANFAKTGGSKTSAEVGPDPAMVLGMAPWIDAKVCLPAHDTRDRQGHLMYAGKPDDCVDKHFHRLDNDDDYNLCYNLVFVACGAAGKLPGMTPNAGKIHFAQAPKDINRDYKHNRLVKPEQLAVTVHEVCLVSKMCPSCSESLWGEPGSNGLVECTCVGAEANIPHDLFPKKVEGVAVDVPVVKQGS